MFKNVAAKFMVFAFDATTNVPKTGDAANITAYVSKDYGTVTVLADTSATEMDATNAPGYYLFDAAQGETNADCLMVSGKSSTANIKIIGAPAVIYTRPTTGWLAPTTAARTLTVDASGNVTLADAVAHGGTLGSSTATLALSRFNATSQTSNTSAFTATGNGTGNGATIASGSGATGTGVAISSAATNGTGVTITGAGTGNGLTGVGGATGIGIVGQGGGTSGEGIKAVASAGNSNGITIQGTGSGPGLFVSAGATGIGIAVQGGATSGSGMQITTTSGNGITVAPTAGHGIAITADGTSKHGITSTGGTGGTSDGIKAVAGTGGVDIRGNITGNLVGTVSTLTTYTGNTVQTADVATLITTVGAAGAGLTAVGLATTSRAGIRKNVAITAFEILMTDSTNHNPATGLTVTVTRSIDGATFAALAVTTVTEIANGWYKFDFAASDLNGTVIGVRATATGADDLAFTIKTSP